MAKSNFGGGNIFRNQRKIDSMSININHADNHNEKQPDISGDIEITKDAARYLSLRPSKTKRQGCLKEGKQKVSRLRNLRLPGRSGRAKAVSIFRSGYRSRTRNQRLNRRFKNDDLDDEIPF